MAQPENHLERETLEQPFPVDVRLCWESASACSGCSSPAARLPKSTVLAFSLAIAPVFQPESTVRGCRRNLDPGNDSALGRTKLWQGRGDRVRVGCGAHELVKVNPIDWTNERVRAYIRKPMFRTTYCRISAIPALAAVIATVPSKPGNTRGPDAGQDSTRPRAACTSPCRQNAPVECRRRSGSNPALVG